MSPIALVAVAMCLAAEQAPPKLAMPGLSVLGNDERYGEFLNEHLAQQLKFEGLDVVTNKEIASLLGFERQKQLLGCGETSTSCMAELASALGVDGVVLGDLAKFGGKTQINLKILAARDGKTLAAFSDRVDGDEAVLDSLTRSAAVLARGVASALHRTLTSSNLSQSGNKPLWLVPGIAGLVAVGVGVGLFVSGGDDYTRLKSATPSAPLILSDARTLRDGGSLKQSVGVACLGVGAAALVGAGLWLALGRPERSGVALVPGSDGAALVITGELP